jgi:integral membrane protein
VSGRLNRFLTLGGTAGALARYRTMALIVGTGLAILCFVGIPLQLAGGAPLGQNNWPWTSVVEIVGPLHGIFYIVYLLACLDLASRARFKTGQLLGMVCSGLLPLLAFYMERRVTERVRSQLALGADAPPGPAAAFWATLSGQSRRDAEAAARARQQGSQLEHDERPADRVEDASSPGQVKGSR